MLAEELVYERPSGDEAKRSVDALPELINPETGRILRVRVGDIAKVEFGHKKRSARIRNRGENAIVVNAVRDTGANVMDAMAGIQKVVDELNRGILPSAGLIMKQVHDDTVYIKFAINLVTQNIWVGGTLAAIILLLFLRSFGATAVVSLAIPLLLPAARRSRGRRRRLRET